MKKTVALTLCLLILMFSSFSTSTFAAIIETKQLTIEEKELVKEKKALREWCISNNIAKKFSPDTRAERVAARRKILNEMLSGEMEQTIGLEKLEELGVYVLESSLLSNNQILPLASPTVLSFNNVIVLYNSEDDVWELGGGLRWTDDAEWLSYVTNVGIPENGNYNIGGLDGAGISLYSTYGSYQSCALIDTSLYVSTGSGIKSTTTHAPTGSIDASRGVFHQFQDHVYCKENNFFSDDLLYYYGKHISVFAQYNAEFENFHGKARLEYVHTWDTTTITSISSQIGIDSVGFSYTFNNTSNQFVAYCPRETIF